MNEFIANFHFLRPLYLLALVPVVLVFWLMLQRHRKSSHWTSLIDAKLLPYLMDGKITKAQRFPLYCLLALWIVFCFALAGPTWEKRALPIQKDLSSMVILWDMSPSMVAKDLEPSRLVRSRLKLVDLLNARKEGLTALIVYAGDAHVVTPLTDDTKTIKSLLPGLAPDVLPQAGSAPELAFAMAQSLLKDAGILKGNIVFVTDGIASGAISELQSIASQSRHKVTIWGFGSAEGAPIPLPNGGFARNRQGEIVVAKLDHALLSEAAVKMDGVYIPYTNNNNDLENIQHFGFGDYREQDGAKQDSDDSKISEQWLEQGHWLVLLALPFAALLFRRGWLFCLAFGVFLTPETQALGWSDLWQNDDQQARNLLQQNEPEAAAQKFDDPQWKAVAKYKAGEFSEAAELFKQKEDSQGHYNRGNALTQQGAYDDAIAAYDRALEAKPDFADAEHNRAIAQQLKQLQEQQDQQQDQNQQNQDGDESQENQDQQQDGEKQDGQQGEGEQDQEQSQNGEQSDSDQQQNKQEKSDKQGEETDSEQQDGAQTADEEQQKALDEHYKQNKDKDEGQQSEEQEELQQAQAQEPQDGELSDEQQAGVAASMSDEELEQQQALDQWLRKVPDDPSGLLRNKFKYENQVRRRKTTSRFQPDPEAPDDQRW